MAQATKPQATEQQPATVQVEQRAQWAAERARLAVDGIGGRNGAGRFARLADMLAHADVEGVDRITFAQANVAMGAKRLTGPEGVASWRTLLQRFAQVDPEGAQWRVDPEGAIVRRK